MFPSAFNSDAVHPRNRTSMYSTEAQDPRKAMNRRRETAVQIRKQRKETILRKKRLLISSDTTNTDETKMILCLKTSMDIYLQQQAVGNTFANLSQFQTAIQSSNENIFERILDELVENKNELNKARQLISQLLLDLQSAATEKTLAALSIVLQISCYNSSGTKTSFNKQHSSDEGDYYGYVAPKWTDLLLEEQNQLVHAKTTGSNLLSILIRIIENSTINSHCTEVACNILGNLIQDCSSTSSYTLLSAVVPTFWPLFVSRLPASSYCCASILKRDATHLGMDFCYAPTNSGNSTIRLLTHQDICHLLQEGKTETDCAWMIEGLCRREDAAVDYLCSYQTGPSSVLSAFLQRFVHHVAAPSSDAMEFLIPASKAIGSISSACQGRYVPELLSNPQIHASQLIESINRLLEIPFNAPKSSSNLALFSEVAFATGCLLTDAGWPQHPSTNVAAPNFIPRLSKVLISPDSKFDEKLAATIALSNACAMPPETPLSARQEVKVTLDEMALKLFWYGLDNHAAATQSLVDLMKLDDTDAVLAALKIVDRLLRANTDTAKSVRRLFEESDGVEALETIGELFSSTSLESKLAAELIDDFFDDDDNDDIEDGMGSPPEVENNRFVFGLPGQNQHQRPLSAAFQLASTPGVLGRGRGKPIPAWMTKTQK